MSFGPFLSQKPYMENYFIGNALLGFSSYSFCLSFRAYARNPPISEPEWCLSFRMNMRNHRQEACFSFEILHFVQNDIRCVGKYFLFHGRWNDSVFENSSPLSFRTEAGRPSVRSLLFCPSVIPNACEESLIRRFSWQEISSAFYTSEWCAFGRRFFTALRSVQNDSYVFPNRS